MARLIDPKGLRGRTLGWARQEMSASRLPPRSDRILDALLYHGELARGEVAPLLSTSSRHGRRLTAALMARGAIGAGSARATLRLEFPGALIDRWLPGAFARA